MNNNSKNNRGFVSSIVIIIIALALLKYFLDWSIFDATQSEKGQATIEYVKNIIISIAIYIKDLIAQIAARGN